MHCVQSSSDVGARATARARFEKSVPRIGSVLDNRFRIRAEIGVGANAIVYAATNVVTSKVVALKWPRKNQSYDCVVREARLAVRVQHPGVVDVYDVGQHDGVFFLTMENIRGVPLRAWLARGRFESCEFIRVFGKVLETVSALHSGGVAHCDLKPANILLSIDDEGCPMRPKLIDFGSAKVLDACAVDAGSSGRIVHAGSEPYMPPEQRSQHDSMDHRVDVFALGMILDLLVRARCVSPRSNASAALLRVVERATAADARDRFATAAEFSRALQAAWGPRRVSRDTRPMQSA